jgi:methylated-DNA-[protein]-cysteine S-methyltransferase
MEARSHEHYCLFDTAIGSCGIAWSDRGVTRLQLPERDSAATEARMRRRSPGASPAEPPVAVAGAIAGLQRYLGGEKTDFSAIPLDLASVSAFDRKIYDAARTVAWGETTSYGELAKKAGMPGEAQETGQSLSRNPVAIIVPCHRVLAAGGKPGGFSAYGGVLTKERLLSLENVELRPPVLPGLFSSSAR